MEQAEHWNNRYLTGDTPWDTGNVSPELMRVIADKAITPCRVVELGCGTGTNSIWLAQQGFEVTGVDISEEALQTAREKAGNLPLRFVGGDVFDLPDLGDPFPFFFDRGCYHVVRRTDVQAYLQSLKKLTTADAVGLVLAGNAKEPQDPGPPVVSEEEIRSELGQVFEIRWLREFRFDGKPGSGDNFLGWSCFLQKKAE